MLAASHAAPSPGESRWVCRRDRQADRHTDGRTIGQQSVIRPPRGRAHSKMLALAATRFGVVAQLNTRRRCCASPRLEAININRTWAGLSRVHYLTASCRSRQVPACEDGRIGIDGSAQTYVIQPARWWRLDAIKSIRDRTLLVCGCHVISRGRRRRRRSVRK